MAGAKAANIIANKPFTVSVASFGEKAVYIALMQQVQTAEPHPENYMESSIFLVELFVLGDKTDQKFRKQSVNAHEVQTNKKQFGDPRKQDMEADEKPIKVDDIDLHIRGDRQDEVCHMLCKHEGTWSGKLGDMNVTTMRIDVVPDAKPFKYPPYTAGPKTRELERAKIGKQLVACVIELAQLDWAALVLLVSKRDGTFWFCIDYRKLNTMTVEDTYPAPRMDGCSDFVGHAQYFTTLDAY